jgi:hypothetical protein
MIMSRVGRASSWHLRRLVVVPLAIGAVIAIGACGSSAKPSAAVKGSPATLVSQTVAASDGIDSGRVSLSVDLALDGIKQLGGKPIALNVSGPFQRSAGSVSTDLAATVSIASSTANVGINKVGKSVYLNLGGTFYKLKAQSPTAATGASGATGLLALGATGATGASGLLSSLGIDPGTWLTDPHEVGQMSVGGVSTDHLTAQINVANVLGDVSKLMRGAAGSSGGAATSSSTLALVESAITKAQVDVYTGVADHIVRRFDLAIAFTVPQIAAAALGGLTGGSLTLDAKLTDVNQPQTIFAPSNAQPSSKLLNGVFALESKFGSLASLVAGLGGSGSNFGGLFSTGTSTSSSTSASSS